MYEDCHQILDTSISLEQSFLNDYDVFTVNQGVKKISRKTNELAATRKSLSRTSSEKSLGKEDVNKFFVKMSCLKNMTEDVQPSTREDILRRQEPKHEKKRTPTPVPGFLVRKRQQKRETVNRELQLENQLLISELQNKLNEENQRVLHFEKKSLTLEKQLIAKTRKIEQLQKQLILRSAKEQQMMRKLQQYQSIVMQHQSNLTQSKNKLEKIKNSIKACRLAQLEAENSKLKKNNQNLSIRITELEEESKWNQKRCTSLEKENFTLKNNHVFDKKKTRDSSYGENLEDMLMSRDEYNQKLQSRVSKLQIELNYLNRKKLQEIQQWKKKKDKQLGRVRRRLCQLSKEFAQYRKEHGRVSTQSTGDISISRTSIMSVQSPRSREEIISFSLSPEHLDS